MHGDFDEDELEDDDFDENISPICSDCGCDLETELHNWDCAFVDDDLDEDDDGDES